MGSKIGNRRRGYIRYLHKTHGWGCHKIANELGISPATVHKYLYKEKPFKPESDSYTEISGLV